MNPVEVVRGDGPPTPHLPHLPRPILAKRGARCRVVAGTGRRIERLCGGLERLVALAPGLKA